MAEESSGFLGRWSRRKTDVLQGKPPAEPVIPAQSVPGGVSVAGSAVRAPAEPLAVQSAALTEQSMPTLEDVQRLTKDSDFKPFMAKGVGTDVRNAAMKKLFTDPQYNVMDGLDIYIDDYSKSDPIPESMLRQMTSSKFLKLFDDDEDTKKSEAEGRLRENANNLTDQTVAQSYVETDIAEADAALQINSSQPELLPESGTSMASQRDHDHPDLRLQPDYAAPVPDAGRST